MSYGPKTIAQEGEYWCPDCAEKIADSYQEVAEVAGTRGRQIWLCPKCYNDLILVEESMTECPYGGGRLESSIPESQRGYRVRCPTHGEVVIRAFI